MFVGILCVCEVRLTGDPFAQCFVRLIIPRGAFVPGKLRRNAPVSQDCLKRLPILTARAKGTAHTRGPTEPEHTGTASASSGSLVRVARSAGLPGGYDLEAGARLDGVLCGRCRRRSLRRRCAAKDRR